MTETTELNPENGTCIGCRLPWNGESGTGYCRDAVLVIADDNGMEVTEILLPLNKGEQKDLAAPLISTGQRVREILIIPREQSTSGRQMPRIEPEIPKKHPNREEPESSAEQSTPEEKLTPTEPDIPIKHVNREEPESSAERSTPEEKLTPAEPDIPIKHPNREKPGIADDRDMPVKPAAQKGQKTHTEPELDSTPEIIIGVRV